MKFSKIVLALLLILAITAACFACAPAGEDNPPDETPGGETPGGETPGGETPGGETPGGETPGGETPGDEEPEPTGEFSIVFQRGRTGECVVAGFVGRGEGEIVIPSTYLLEGDEEESIVVGIAAGAFRNCKYITSIVVPDSVKTIGLGAFEGCAALESITLPFVGGAPTANTYIGHIFGAQTFTENAAFVPASLATVNLSEACTAIAPFAFDACTGVKAVHMGNEMATIGAYAFARCGITEVSLPDSVTTLGVGAYLECPVEKVVLPFVGADNTGAIGYLGHMFGAANYAQNKDFVPATLKQLSLSTVCTTIGAGAFNDCVALEEIDLPNTITNIGENAFTNTPYFDAKPDGLVYVDTVLYTYKGEMGEATDIVVEPGTIAIAAGAFDGLPITSISIPDSVVNIGAAAFRGSKLADITLPFIGENVAAPANNYLGYIFGAASAEENASCVPETLRTVTLYDGCTTIAARAFYGCANLTAVNVGSGVTSIAKDAFFDCRALADITIDAENASYKNDSKLVYNVAGDDLIAVPMAVKGDITLLNITEIAEGQFRNCTGITSIVLPETLIKIGDQAFYGLEGLADVNFPESLVGVGAGAFEGTGWYNSQPDGVVYTGNVLYKFKGESGSEIKVLDTVTGIAAGAFANCNIVSVDIPASVTNIGEGAFQNCQLQSITVPFIGADATDETKSYLGYLFGAPSSAVAGNFVPATLKSVTLLDGCASIGPGAFNGCANVEELNIPQSVTYVAGEALNQTAWFKSREAGVVYVGRVAYAFVAPEKTHQEYLDEIAALPEDAEPIVSPYEVVLRADTTAIADKAFYRAEIVSIRIPDTTIYIGDSAFYNCLALAKLRMPSFLETLGEYAFYSCKALTEVYIPGTVVDIPQFAFYNCDALRSATFGEGIKTIGASAFSSCDAFYTYSYTGNKPDWDEVVKDDSNKDLFNVRTPKYGVLYTPEPFEIVEEEA